MRKRTAKALADAFEPTLASKLRMNLQCESKDEAVLLAHELTKRGWKAVATNGLSGPIDNLRVVDVVRVTGRRKERG